jgi:GT2 family glycosyltransferase
MEAWKESTVDWMLWVDSDVVITPQIVNDLWAAADKDTAPVVSGVYFTFWRPEGTSVPTPVPTIFNVSPEGTSTPVHPLPENQLIEVGYIGMGLVLIHRSIFEKLDPLFNGLYFDESMSPGGIFMSEDGSFCAKLRTAKIPILVHTGIIAQHMKRFAVDLNYYNAYWTKLNPQSPVEAKQEIHRP